VLLTYVHLAHRGILCELASAGDFPLPHASPTAGGGSGGKRERDADSPRSAATPDYDYDYAMSQDASPPAQQQPPARMARPHAFAPRHPPHTAHTNAHANPHAAAAQAAAAAAALAPPAPDYATLLDPPPLLPNPNFMQHDLAPAAGPAHAHAHAARGDPMTGVQWFAPSQHMAGAAQAPVLQHLFAGEDAQYAAAPVSGHASGPAPGPAGFGGGFANGGGDQGAAAAAWGGDTLNMWSTAPTGFECVSSVRPSMRDGR
jgi:hypothetical protein